MNQKTDAQRTEEKGMPADPARPKPASESPAASGPNAPAAKGDGDTETGGYEERREDSTQSDPEASNRKGGYGAG